MTFEERFREQQNELRAALEAWELRKAHARRVWREAGINLEEFADMPATEKALREARMATTILLQERKAEP